MIRINTLNRCGGTLTIELMPEFLHPVHHRRSTNGRVCSTPKRSFQNLLDACVRFEIEQWTFAPAEGRTVAECDLEFIDGRD